MGSTIKGTKKDGEEERERGGEKKSASNRAVHEREECFHICGTGGFWVLSDIDDHSVRCEVISFHKETPSCL